MARLTIHTVESAPEKAKPRVEAALKNNGFLPNLIGVLANSPEALAFYQEVGKLNGETSLTAGEREVVQILAAKINQCGFCVAGHTKLATLKKLLKEEEIQAVRAVAPIADANGHSLANAVRARGLVEPIYCADVQALPQTLLSILQDGDVVLTMGAGSINRVPAAMLELSKKA